MYAIFVDEGVYPQDLDCQLCSRREVREFAEEAKTLGVQYIGLCCGNSPANLREVAQVFGRRPGACDYSPDMSNSMSFSKDPTLMKFQSYFFDSEKYKDDL